MPPKTPKSQEVQKEPSPNEEKVANVETVESNPDSQDGENHHGKGGQFKEIGGGVRVPA